MNSVTSNSVTTNSTDTTEQQYAITAEKLNLWYGSFQALYDIDLKIKKGMISSNKYGNSKLN